MNWEQVTDELNKPLERGAVRQRQQGTFKLSYIEGWHAIAEANRIFGHGNWDRETVEMLRCGEPYQNDKQNWVVNYVCRVRISVGSGARDTARDGSGFGSGIDRDLGRAHESAVKEAETDATKRALMTFGWPFGLALYDKTQEHVSDGVEDAPEPVGKVVRLPKDMDSNVSSLQSKGMWSIIVDEMLNKNKTAEDLNQWYVERQPQIKKMSNGYQWDLFEKVIEFGIDELSPTAMDANMFWTSHKMRLEKFNELDRYRYEALEERLIKRCATLTDPNATIEFRNPLNAG